jgi:peptidyl-prolyl cis-trans isomerase B (cyclophilin B)
MKAVAASLLLLMAAACAPNKQPNTDVQATATTASAPVAKQPEPVPVPQEKPMSEYKDKVVDLKTSKGTISIRFFPEVAPNHVRNFIDLAESGFYNGVKFHRVVPGFVIQGGDPNTKSGERYTWGTGGSGKNVKAEFNSIHHRRGILSMARSGHPDSASSQFFIVVADAGFLDNQYTVFGEVTSGMDAVDAIVAAPKNGESPVDPVAIESATVRDAKESEKGPIPK